MSRLAAVSARRGSGVVLAIVTSAFSAMLLSANLATPLYAVWAKQFGFSTAMLALIFAVYALVLIPALLIFGQLSDRLGRRVVIAMGLCLALLALVFFALATATAWLFAARATLGVAQGMLSGAATAALAELVPEGNAPPGRIAGHAVPSSGHRRGGADLRRAGPVGTSAASAAVHRRHDHLRAGRRGAPVRA